MSTPLADYIESVATWIRTAFPDLEFHAPGGLLSIRREAADVIGLRIELTERAVLRLHSLSIDSDDLTDPVAQTTLRDSGGREGPRSRVVPRELFDPAGEHRAALSTGEQDLPWVELLFDRPITLRGLRIRNADVKEAERVRSVRVVARHRDGDTILYDGAARVRDLSRAVDGMLGHSTAELSVDERGLAGILREVASGHLEELPARLRDLPEATPADRRQIRRAVNATLLAGQHREWNIHTVRRTFRYWTDEERRGYVDGARRLIEVLRDLSPSVCLGFGGVLGLVREGGLIAHDDDLDVIVAFEPEQAATIADGLVLVEKHLRSHGYRVWGAHLAHRFASVGDGKIDVFVGLFEGDTVSWYPGPRGTLRRGDVFPPLPVTLLEQDVVIPRNPTVYLEKVYGPRWRTPNPAYSHRWARKPYEDIAGQRR